MKRRLLVFGMIVVPFILLLFALQLRVEAAPTGQLIRDPRTDAAEAEAEPAPLSQPITVTIYQQVPLTLALLLEEGAQLAGEFPPTTPLTLRFSFQFALTQTLTSTVPSSVSMVFSDGLAVRLPFSLALGVAPSATVVVTTPEQIAEATPTHTPTATPTRTPTASPTPSPTPSPSPSPTAEVTATAELSPTALFTAGEGITTTTEISPIAPISTPLPPVSSRVNITANLRAAPGVDSEVIGQIGLGQPVVVAGLSTDGSWYLLSNGAWIAIGLIDNAPANPPVVDEARINTVRATATAAALANPTPVVETTPTPPALLLPTPTATPQPVPPSVTVNANLRAGPGLEFPITGGTIANEPVQIVARNESGDWFLLANGGWVATFLIANPPDIATVPVYNPQQPGGETTTTAPVTTTAAVTATAPVTTGVAATTTAPTTTTPPATLGVLDNLYLVDAAELIARYDRALGQIDQLIAQAAQNEALLRDQQWVQSMTTAIALLRATDARVRALQPTALLTPVQNDLLAAAEDFDSAATLIAQGVDSADPARFDEAFVAITRGNASLGNASDQIDALTP